MGTFMEGAFPWAVLGVEVGGHSLSRILLWILVALYVGVSLVTFGVYGWDKHRARRGGRRVPERTLHALALAGGWPGAWLAQVTFRHKTRKGSFQIGFWAVVAVHLLAWTAVVWWWWNHRQGT
jgi:uncharacterized membrane protein YsdA (DUF1294 family)